MGPRSRVEGRARLVPRQVAESRFSACSNACRSRCTRRAEHPQRRSWQSAHSHVPIGIRIWHGWQMPPQRKPVWSMGEVRSSSAGHSPNRLGVRACSAEASSAVISSRLRSAARTEVLMATQCGAGLPGTSAVHTCCLHSGSGGYVPIGSSAGCGGSTPALRSSPRSTSSIEMPCQKRCAHSSWSRAAAWRQPTDYSWSPCSSHTAQLLPQRQICRASHAKAAIGDSGATA